MFENKERTDIETLGEFGLIDHITKHIKINHKSTVKGVGDDAAVIAIGNGKVQVITTDLLTEGIHFDLTYCPLKHLGYKAIVVNLSDVYAMNAEPKQVTVSIAVSSRFSLEAVEELYAGILAACDAYNVDLVGGDTTSSLSGLTISVTAIGEAKETDVVYRNTANEGDLICVSGDLGAAYMGLQILEREKQIFKESPGVQPDLGTNDYILERQLKPEARKAVYEKLKELGIKPTSMIDVSDGLASEILHICHQSDKGCDVYEDKLPIDYTTENAARDFKLDPTVCAMSGGEDYELLFTIKQSDFETIKDLEVVSIIGHVKDKAAGTNLITKGGNSYEITAQGWDAFKKYKEQGK